MAIAMVDIDIIKVDRNSSKKRLFVFVCFVILIVFGIDFLG